MIKKAGPETTEYENRNGVGVITYRSLNSLPWLMNAFSTREGGISEGYYATMNFAHWVGDDLDRVLENYRIFGRAIGVEPENMVLAHQTHTDHVMKAASAHKGMGITRERDFKDIDGLVTDEPGLCLVTSFADCVPLYFVDPVHKAIGLTHSGWRGTAARIATNTIRLMREEYGTDPSELICCIGPCIEKSCYEVSQDVAEEFRAAYKTEQYERICTPRDGLPGKYLLDLPQASYEQFLDCGVKPDHISMPDLCTVCNCSLLHSHRATGGRRGGMCAFLMIRKN